MRKNRGLRGWWERCSVSQLDIDLEFRASPWHHHSLRISRCTPSTGAGTRLLRIDRVCSLSLSLAAEGESAKIDWEWMLVLGVFLGAFASSRLSGDRTHPVVPRLWAWRFGEGTGKRFLGAFFGAALMLFGARVAHGCTSGHGISGNMQLAVSSWIFTAVIFLTAIGCVSGLSLERFCRKVGWRNTL